MSNSPNAPPRKKIAWAAMAGLVAVPVIAMALVGLGVGSLGKKDRKVSAPEIEQPPPSAAAAVEVTPTRRVERRYAPRAEPRWSPEPSADGGRIAEAENEEQGLDDTKGSEQVNSGSPPVQQSDWERLARLSPTEQQQLAQSAAWERLAQLSPAEQERLVQLAQWQELAQLNSTSQEQLVALSYLQELTQLSPTEQKELVDWLWGTLGALTPEQQTALAEYAKQHPEH